MKLVYTISICLILLSGGWISTTISTTNGQQNEHTIVYATPYRIGMYAYWSELPYGYSPWISAVFSSLLKRDGSSERAWVPNLAAELPTGSGSEFTVSIRENAKFSTGEPITANDVVFSFQVAVTPLINRRNYESISKYFDNSSFIKIDESTVKFVFNKPTGFALSLLSVPIIPLAAFETRYNSCVAGNRLDCVWNDPTGADALSAGPFMVESFDPIRVTLTLIKNPNYWNASGLETDKIIFKQISDRDEAFTALVSGEVDIVDENYLFAVNDFEDYDTLHDELVESLSYHELSLNHRSPFWGNGSAVPDGDATDDAMDALLIRRAMSHILDREFISNYSLGGQAIPATSSMPPASIGWDADLEPDEYNITLAKELMTLAGFNYSTLNDTDSDGVYETFFFNITVLAPLSHAPNYWPNLFVNELPKIGIGVKDYVVAGWDVITQRTFLRDTPPGLYDEGGYDVLFVGYTWDIDWDPTGHYEESSFLPNGFNFHNYVNRTLENLISNYTMEQDLGTRIKMAHDVQKAIHDDLPVIPIFYPLAHWVWNETVKGLDPILLSISLQEWEDVYKDDWSNSNPSTSPTPTTLPEQTISTTLPEQTTSTQSPIPLGWLSIMIAVFVLPLTRKQKKPSHYKQLIST